MVRVQPCPVGRVAQLAERRTFVPSLYGPVVQWLTRRLVTPKNVGSIPTRVALIDKSAIVLLHLGARDVGSNPARPTWGGSLTVERVISLSRIFQRHSDMPLICLFGG